MRNNSNNRPCGYVQLNTYRSCRNYIMIGSAIRIDLEGRLVENRWLCRIINCLPVAIADRQLDNALFDICTLIAEHCIFFSLSLLHTIFQSLYSMINHENKDWNKFLLLLAYSSTPTLLLISWHRSDGTQRRLLILISRATRMRHRSLSGRSSTRFRCFLIASVPLSLDSSFLSFVWLIGDNIK